MANADASETHNSFPNEAESSCNNHSTVVVFQCAQCNSVVGDSTSWLTADKVMRTITLAFVTSKVGVKPMIEISKTGVDKDSYEVGSAEKGGQDNMADMLTVPTANYLEREVGKLRYLIMSLNHRMKTIETHLNLELNSLSTTSESYQNGNQNQQNNGKNLGESDSVSSSENVMETNCLQDQQMFRHLGGKSHNHDHESSGKVPIRNTAGNESNEDFVYKTRLNRSRGSKFVQGGHTSSLMGEPGSNRMREPGSDRMGEPGSNRMREPGSDRMGEPGSNRMREPGSDRMGEPGSNRIREPGSDRMGEPSGNRLVEPASNRMVEPGSNMLQLREPGNNRMREPVSYRMRGACHVVKDVEQRSRVLQDVRDDVTDVSEIVTEMEGNHASLMEEWPSPSGQNRRGRKRRKFDNN